MKTTQKLIEIGDYLIITWFILYILTSIYFGAFHPFTEYVSDTHKATDLVIGFIGGLGLCAYIIAIINHIKSQIKS